jgi:hypothetical protein
MENMNNQAAAPQGNWHLFTRNGDMTARIRAGMRIGEDESGVISLVPDEALIVFDISERGTLLLRTSTPAHEFITPQQDRKSLIEIGPEISAEICTGNDKLLIDKDFGATGHAGSILRFELAETLYVEESASQPVVQIRCLSLR